MRGDLGPQTLNSNVQWGEPHPNQVNWNNEGW